MPYLAGSMLMGLLVAAVAGPHLNATVAGPQPAPVPAATGS